MTLWVLAAIWGTLTLALAGCVFAWLPTRHPPAGICEPAGCDRPVVLVVIAVLARGLAWLLLYGQGNATDPLSPADRCFWLILGAGATWLLSAIAARQRLPRWTVLFYAGNPLIIWAWAAGWPCILLTFLIVAAIHAGNQKRNQWLALMLMGAAIAVNMAALLLLPMLITRRNRRWLWVAGLPPLFTLTGWRGGLPIEAKLGFAPFLRASSRLFQGHQSPFESWFLADALSRLAWIPQPVIYTIAVVLLLMAITTIWLLAKDDSPSAMALSWMWILVLFPGLTPQHLVPLAALLIFNPQRSWLAVLAGSGVWITHGYDAWLPVGFWMVLAAGVVYDSMRLVKPSARRYGPARNLDIVIPTLNEGDLLGRMLSELQTAIQTLLQPDPRQARDSREVKVIIVDAGSTDNTVMIAQQMGAQVIHADEPGRGSQFAQGIAAGNAGLILMLHADTQMHPHALEQLCSRLDAAPRIGWGILGHIYSRRDLRMRVIEITNRLRFHLAGVAFGDQGIFVRREILDAIGGLPELRLMEDIELSLRLTAYKCRLDCGASLVTSTRHWDQRSYSGYMKTVLWLSAVYLWCRAFGVDVRRMAKQLYERYYQRPATDVEAVDTG